MHIGQEMSKNKDSKHNPPNVVAKLMGLEAPPRGEPNSVVERSHRKDYPQHMYGHSWPQFKHWQLNDRFMDKQMLNDHEVHHPSTEQIAYKDIYEIWLQKSQRSTSHVRDRGISWSDEDVDEKRMALIHQKFLEARRLSTDERLRQSKQFQDALEVLSSNSDVLIRLLDSQNLYQLHCASPVETKHITLLKPLKMVDKDNEKCDGKRNKSDGQTKKAANVGKAVVCEKKDTVDFSASEKVDEFPVQSTRIVVLRPVSGKTHEIKAVVSPITSSHQNLRSGNFYEEPEDDDVLESRKVAEEITPQMHGTLYSSVFSNGHRGDESSFNKSYHECEAGNSSDLEAMSILSRHSWDCINDCGGSTYSAPSLGLASFSPESSVSREAKKRLSERWIMMASNNKGPQEQWHVKRSSTLGEMLSLSRIKKPVTSEVESVDVEDQEPSKSVSCSNSFYEEISSGGSPKNPPRSIYEPASSTVCETGVRVEVCDHDAGKAHGSKVQTKSKSMKSSFKGKVMSFLFSRNKKSTKEKSSLSQSKHESESSVTDILVSSVNSPGFLRDDLSQSFNSFEECSLPALCESLGKTSSDSVSKGQQQGIISLEHGLALSKPMAPEISRENQNQPCPISVLKPPFEDDNAAHESLGCMKGGHQGSRLLLKSNLIDKSPHIESIARTLSWDDSGSEVASQYPLKPLMVSSLDTRVEEQEWLLYVEKLLSAAGIDDEVQFDSFYTRWHSHESPLDPSLRDKYATNLNGKEPQPLHEAKRRKIRSKQKLVFDCVNAALLEITVYYGSEKYFKSRMYSGSHTVQEGASPCLVDHIVAQMKELIASGIRCAWGDCGDKNSLVVENVVRKEVVGIGWVELMGLEIDILGMEIEGQLIGELVENAVADFTGRA